MCARMARAYAGAAKIIQEKPAEALETPEEALRQDGSGAARPPPGRWCPKAHAKDIRVTRRRGSRTRRRSASRPKLLEPKDALKSFDGLYTDEFLR